MLRYSPILAAAWSLLATPWLCVAEVLPHPCNHGEESEYGHESDCPSDPCSSVTVTPALARGSEQLRQGAKATPFPLVSVGSCLTGRPKHCDTRAVEWCRAGPLDRELLPMLPGDIPLLI